MVSWVHRLLGQGHLHVRKGPWSLRGPRGMAMARASLVRSSLAWLHVSSSGPCTVCVPGAAGHNRWGVAETPLPVKTQGRTRDAAFNVVSFKPERAFKVIAHVRDWEHAETGLTVTVQEDRRRLCTPCGVHGPRVTCG